jgi:hypothetical protein
MGVATKEDDMELSVPPTFCGEYGRDLVMGIVALVRERCLANCRTTSSYTSCKFNIPTQTIVNSRI